MAVKVYGPWIDWSGRSKRSPLPAGTRHQVRFRDGTTANDDKPETWTWKHGNDGADIMAYRIRTA